MIKEFKLFGRIYYMPGWANFLVLFLIYFALAKFLKLISHSVAEDWFVIIICLCFCGAYLAKWRFYNGGWHFR